MLMYAEQHVEFREFIEQAIGSESTKISELYPISNDVCAIMDWNVGTLKGYALKIFTRDSDNWKIGMSYLNGSPGT